MGSILLLLATTGGLFAAGMEYARRHPERPWQDLAEAIKRKMADRRTKTPDPPTEPAPPPA